MDVVTMHECKTIITVLIAECTTNYGFTHINFVRNVAHVRFFHSRAREFLTDQEDLTKGSPFRKIGN